MLLPTRMRSLCKLCSRVSWLEGRARGHQAAVQFPLDQRRILEQSDHLCPDDLVKQILPDHTTIADGAAQFSPTVRANAFVVVDLARACGGRSAGERVTAFLAADQPLHYARRDRTPTRSQFVLVEQFLSAREALLAYQCRHRNLDPLLARTCPTVRAGPRSQTPGDDLLSGFHAVLHAQSEGQFQNWDAHGKDTPSA
jgi:hypothetical protein